MFFKKLLVLSFSFSLLLAQSSNTDKNIQKEIQNGFNPPYRIEVKDSWNFFLSSSYLYWQVKEKGLEFARSEIQHQERKVSFKEVDFKYLSGFKVAAASNFNHDKWRIFCEYTCIHEEHSTKALAPNGGYLVPLLIFFEDIDEPGTNQHASQVIDTWYFSYDMLDLLIDRSYFVGKHLIFKTFVGTRGGWIDQKNLFQSFFTNLIQNENHTIEVKSLSRSSSWMIGPNIGVNTDWTFGPFRLFSSGSASLLYQHFLFSFKQGDYIVLKKRDIFSKDKIGYINPNFDLSFGMGLRKHLLKDSWNVDFSMSYNFLYFFNQNFLRQISDKMLYRIETKPSSLTLHGLTITLGFDF